MLQQRFRCHRRDLKHFVNLFDGCCLRTHQCLHWEVLWKCGEEGWIQEKKRRRIKTESDPGQVRHSFPSALGGHTFVPRTPRRSQSMRQLHICRPPLKKKEKKKNSSIHCRDIPARVRVLGDIGHWMAMPGHQVQLRLRH